MKIKQNKLSHQDADELGFGGLMSGFGGMLYVNDYSDRKVDNTKTKFGEVDTAYTSDTGYFETGICDTRYREDGEWIIVDECETKEEAKKMHKKWVKALTAKDLPDEIEDIHSSETYKLSP